MTVIQQIRLLLQASGLSAKEFEVLMLYDLGMLRVMIGGQHLTNREVLTQGAPQIGAGICGEVANQLAEIFLGARTGQALKKLLNDMTDTEEGELRTGSLDGRHACWGQGASAVGKSALSLFVFADAFYLINLGTAHRFVALKQGSQIELLQTWYDPQANLGYALSDWLKLDNTRISRTFAQFVEDLGKMSGGSRSSAKELFQPVGGPHLPEDHFDLGDEELTFAAVQISSKEMGSNFVKHYSIKSSALE